MSEVNIYTGDVNGLRSLIDAWAEEAQGDQFGIVLDPDYVLADLANIVINPDALLLVLCDETNPVGLMGLRFFTSPTGPQLIAQEHYWFVRPESRGIQSIRLLKAAIRIAASFGCSHLEVSASRMASNSHDPVCKLYERMGGKHFETTYMLQV